jgi:hypothetical protein
MPTLYGTNILFKPIQTQNKLHNRFIQFRILFLWKLPMQTAFNRHKFNFHAHFYVFFMQKCSDYLRLPTYRLFITKY